MIGVIGPRDINPSTCTCVYVIQPEGQLGVIRVFGPRGSNLYLCLCVTAGGTAWRDTCGWL